MLKGLFSDRYSILDMWATFAVYHLLSVSMWWLLALAPWFIISLAIKLKL